MIKRKTITQKIMLLIAVSMAVSTLFACENAETNEHHPLHNYSYYTSSMSSSASAMTQSAGTMSAAAPTSASATSDAHASNSNSLSSTPPAYWGTGGYKSYNLGDSDAGFITEEYSTLTENVFKDVSTSPLSTFSADVDTASYANVRRMIYSGRQPEYIPTGAARIEEMINYFSYNYKGPKSGEPFGINAEISDCPWNKDHRLVRIGLQTEAIDFSKSMDSNIVLLIDVSGSMDSYDKLPLLQESFCLMVDNLSEKDRISIVTYAGASNTVLEGVSGADKEIIKEAINSLSPYGSTNGSGGIKQAYKLAKDNFIENGNNRVIIATDGDFNVGVTSESELSDLIKEKAKDEIYLSVIGFGTGNYADARMETLADDGNGNYSYIDSMAEAKKVLGKDFGANMVTVAKDVKLQVEFNPAYVSEYRLLGYEDRMLNNEDFDDDTKDAGEIGAGHSVTVLYEIVPGARSYEGSGLKYQTSTLTDQAKNTNEWLTLKVRYKNPGSDFSTLLEYNIGDNEYTDKPSEDFKFQAAVAEFAMILRQSKYVNGKDFKHVRSLLKTIKTNDEYKEEFADMVDVCIENSN